MLLGIPAPVIGLPNTKSILRSPNTASKSLALTLMYRLLLPQLLLPLFITPVIFGTEVILAVVAAAPVLHVTPPPEAICAKLGCPP